MTFGLGALLLLIAIILFLLGALTDSNFDKYLTLGLAAFAGSFLATSLGWGDRKLGSRS